MSQPKISNEQLAGPFFDIANIIRVDKNPGVGAYSSIKTAVDSVTNATALNPVAVFVGPGWYTEDTITLKPYIKLVGWAGETHTFIQPLVTTQTLVVGANSAMIEGFSLNGATGVGGTGIYFASTSNSTQGTFRISNIRFLANTINCYLVSSGFDNYVVGNNMYFVTFNNSTITHLKVESTGTNIMECIFDSTACINITGTGLSEVVLVTGPYAQATFNNVTMKCLGANSVGDGVVVQDGAHLDVLSGIITNFKNNLVARNVGVAPKFHAAVSMSADSTTRDVSIEHPGTIGLFSGATNASKVFVAPASTVSLNYSDLQSAGGTVTVGPMFIGPTHADITDVSTLLNETLPTGLLSGGNMTQGTNPLDLNISAGYGYVGIVSTNTFVKKITWTSQVFTLPDNKVNYVYIDVNGTLNRADAPPDPLSTILLGRVKTLGGLITFIGIMPNMAARLSSKLRGFARDAIGTVFKSGCAVTENATAFHLNVSSGDYYYADLNYLPSGGTNINFYPWTDVSGVWTKGTITNLVNHTQYNNTTTGLVSLTTGYFTKHTLWVGGDGVNEQYQLIIGQAEYPTLAQAEAAPLPPISSGFAEITTPIAAIIVQEGAANITEFVDIRPRIGFQNPSTSAATVHGNLFGLLADDHTQYLLVNGTRSMGGNLDLGTHNITNVGTVNGHTIIDAAPVGASYITISNDATLTSERTLAVTLGHLTLTDAGANSTATLGLATAGTSGTYKSVTTDAYGRVTSGTNPTTLSGYGITDAAPIGSSYITVSTDATLTAERTLAVTANQLTLTDGGVNSNITLSIASNPVIPGTGSITIPSGTTAQQSGTPTVGMIRYNTDTSSLEHYKSVAGWKTIADVPQVFTNTIAAANNTTTIPFDNTIPLITEGTQIWSQAITPTTTATKISIQFAINLDASSSNGTIIVAIFRGNTCVSARPWATGSGGGDRPDSISIDYTDSPATTSATTYSCRVGITTGTWYINSTSGGTDLGGTLVTTYKVSEII